MSQINKPDRRLVRVGVVCCRRAMVWCFVIAIGAGIGFATPADAETPSRAKNSSVNDAILKEDIPRLAKLLRLQEGKAARDVPGWKKPKKVVVFADNPQRIAWLQTAAPGVNLVAVTNEEQAINELKDADAQVGGRCALKLIAASGPHLKWVQANHAGLEECLVGNVPPRIAKGEILITSGKRITSPVVAQHAIAMTLALYRGLDVYARLAERGEVTTARNASALPSGRLRDIDGQTMLVVGLGGIGEWVAKYANGLGMRVIGVRASGKEGPDFVEYVGRPDELPTLLPQADVVVIAVPVTSKTTGMVNAKFLSQMKKGAYLVNPSHYNVLVTHDVVAALESGQLGAAATDNMGESVDDVVRPNRAFLAQKNLLITPHKGGYEDDAHGRELSPGIASALWLVARENLRRYVAGDKLYSVIDPQAGY